MRLFGATAAALCLLALAGCGGAVETTPTGTRGEPSGGSPVPPNESTAAPAPPPAPTADPGPSGPLPRPSKIADPPVVGATPFQLVVANRSRDVIGVDFFLDGVEVVNGGFAPGSKVAFDFALEDGAHTLVVKAAESARAQAASKTVPFELAGARWGIVDLSTARCDPCSPVHIGWDLRDKSP